MTMTEPPEGIIITVGAKMWKNHGYKTWLANFLQCMELSTDEDSNISDGLYYWFRMGNRPKIDTQFVYLCIGGKIRYRVYLAEAKGPTTVRLHKGGGRMEAMFGKAWILVAGPVTRAPYKIERKGFQGFRYTEKLF